MTIEDNREVLNVIDENSFITNNENIKKYIDYNVKLNNVYDKALELGYVGSLNQFVKMIIDGINKYASSDNFIYDTAVEVTEFQGSIEDFTQLFIQTCYSDIYSYAVEAGFTGTRDDFAEDILTRLDHNLYENAVKNGYQGTAQDFIDYFVNIDSEINHKVNNAIRANDAGMKTVTLWEGSTNNTSTYFDLSDDVDNYDFITVEFQNSATSRAPLAFIPSEDIVNSYGANETSVLRSFRLSDTNCNGNISFYSNQKFRLTGNTGINAITKVCGLKFSVQVDIDNETVATQVLDDLKTNMSNKLTSIESNQETIVSDIQTLNTNVGYTLSTPIDTERMINTIFSN